MIVLYFRIDRTSEPEIIIHICLEYRLSYCEIDGKCYKLHNGSHLATFELVQVSTKNYIFSYIYETIFK